MWAIHHMSQASREVHGSEEQGWGLFALKVCVQREMPYLHNQLVLISRAAHRASSKGSVSPG